MTPRFVWFDMGNVLLLFSRERQAEALCGLPGCKREVAEIIPFVDGHSQEHLDYELGQISREAFLKRLAAFLGTSAGLGQIDEAYSTLFTRNDPVCQLAAEIARILPVGLATNSDPSHLARVQRDYPDVFGLFSEERILASYGCGHRKPSREFFECMIKQSGYPADSLCFIDDLEANIQGAREAGIVHAVQFDGNAEHLVESLKAGGVVVS